MNTYLDEEQKVIQFKGENARMNEQALMLLNELNQEDGAHKDSIDTLVNIHNLQLHNDLYKIDFRFKDQRHLVLYQLAHKIVQAVLYDNEGIDHPLKEVLDQLVPLGSEL